MARFIYIIVVKQLIKAKNGVKRKFFLQNSFKKTFLCCVMQHKNSQNIR